VLGCGRPFRFPDDSGTGLFVTWADEITGELHPSSVDVTPSPPEISRCEKRWRKTAADFRPFSEKKSWRRCWGERTLQDQEKMTCVFFGTMVLACFGG
jgi:hypothetical protein